MYMSNLLTLNQTSNNKSTRMEGSACLFHCGLLEDDSMFHDVWLDSYQGF